MILNTIDILKLKDILTNDFEKVVFPAYPEIENIKNRLYKSGAIFALMTGSGSTVYGLFPDTASAQKAQNRFPDKYFKFIHLV